MKIKDVWVDFDSGGGFLMNASSTGNRNLNSIQIHPATAPSAIAFIQAFQAGRDLDDADAMEVKRAAILEAPGSPLKIVSMKIEPNIEGFDVLKVTLYREDLEVVVEVWPPRAPSARLFLAAFLRGKPLYDHSLGMLIRFVATEANFVGLSKHFNRGILDWNPDWEEYL